MISKEELRKNLDTLQWTRISKSRLQQLLQGWLQTDNKLENATDMDDKEVDYSFIFTNGEYDSVRNFIDVEIWYLKTRCGMLFITGAEILMYEN